MSASKSYLGYAIELGGVGAFVVGAILSVHHFAIAACFIGGAAAVYIGKKVRALAA
ncbi:MAG TPA: hypothetical protein VGR39_07720 [Candidatus Acidoferrales bacterium]|nr:hypothetical protein [Candidatus Acidoferrales bacterium]